MGWKFRDRGKREDGEIERKVYEMEVDRTTPGYLIREEIQREK